MTQSPQGFKASKERGRATSIPVTHCTTTAGLHASLRCRGAVGSKARLWGKKIKYGYGNSERKLSFQRAIRCKQLASRALRHYHAVLGQPDTVADSRGCTGAARPPLHQLRPRRSPAPCFSLEKLSHILDYFCIVLA